MRNRSGIRKYVEDCRTLPGDAALGYRNEGIRGVWKALASRTLHRCFQAGRVVVFAQSLDQEPKISPPPGIVIEPLAEGECARLATLIGRMELARFSARLAQGRHCVVAWRGSQPVGYGWVAERMGPDNALWPPPFELPEYAAYLCNLYVLPSERRNGVGSALARARLRRAWELGYRAGWRVIAVSNEASLRTIKNSSGAARVVGQVRYVQLLGRTYSRFRPTP